MNQELFTSICEDVTNRCEFFRNNIDCTEREGISALKTCTFAIRQLTYNTVPEALDEYFHMSATTSRASLDYFCKSIMEIYRA
nr:hypothetical protein [Tanacetum cinerariifolium]